MGEILALATALVWAVSVLFFKRSGETMPPYALNFFRVGVSSFFLIITLVLVDTPFWPEATSTDWLLLAASSLVGIVICDTLFHSCLNRVGASITGIVECTYSPFAVLFAWIFLQESMGWFQIIGMVLVVAGVVFALLDPRELGRMQGRGARALLVGASLGVLAMLTVSLGLVLVKPVLDRAPLLWAVTMRQLLSLVIMIPVALMSSKRREIFSVFIPRRHWRFSLTGTLLGSYLALILWLAGMKYSTVGVAAILNQTSTIYLLIFSAIFFKETLTGRKILASFLALLGVLLVTSL